MIVSKRTRQSEPDTRRSKQLPPKSGTMGVAHRRQPEDAVLPAAGNQAMQRLLATGKLRAKLQVGAADDPTEREADHMANAAVHGGGSCSCAPGEPRCPACRAAEQNTVRRKVRAGGAARSVDHVRLGSSRPLATGDRSFFESRYDADLSNVKLHDNPAAAASAAQLNARAFTMGNDVAFGRGEYRPESPEGRLLLAHELAHVAFGHSGVRRQEENASPSEADNESLTCEAEEPGVCMPGTAEAEAPEPGSRTVTFRGYVLSPRPEYLRSVLAQIGATDGYDEMDWFVSDVEYPASAGVTEGGSSGEGAAAVYTAEDMNLLAEIAPVMRSELDRLQADYAAFGDFVRNAAVVRLQRNHHNLGLWRDYVQTLAPAQVMGMALAQKERPVLMAFIHSQSTGPFDPMDIYERRAWSTSRFERDYLERLGTGQIHGGCQQCHEMRLAQDFEYNSPTSGESAIPLARRLPMHAALNAMTPQPSGEIAPVEGENQPAVPDWAFSQIGDRPGSQAIANSLNQIRDYLKPLGDAGYRIISDEMVMGATDGAELVSSVISAIDERRTGYLDLIDEVQTPGYDFLEPLQTLQQLLPFADPAVRSVVDGEMRRRQEEKEAEGTAGIVLGLAAMLLTIFPPTAPIGLALGAGLAVSSLFSGYEDWAQGRRFQMGMGAGVFTRQQEDAGRAMEAMGLVTMALSVLQLGMSGVEGAQLLRGTGAAVTTGAEAAEEVIGAEVRAGGLRIRVEGLDGPAPRITVTHPDGTLEQLTAGELEDLLARTPPAGGASTGGGGAPYESPWTHVPQKQPNWCGAACGEMASARLGGKVTQEELAASELFEDALVIDGDVLRAGGFETPQLGKALEEIGPIEGRTWRGVDLGGKFDIKTPGDVPQFLGQVLQDTESSVILRVRGGNHWIVVDEVTADGFIAIRDPAAATSQLVSPGELAAMHPTGHAVISLPK